MKEKRRVDHFFFLHSVSLHSDGSLHVALTEKMTGITTTATIGAATA